MNSSVAHTRAMIASTASLTGSAVNGAVNLGKDISAFDKAIQSGQGTEYIEKKAARATVEAGKKTAKTAVTATGKAGGYAVRKAGQLRDKWLRFRWQKLKSERARNALVRQEKVK